MPIIVTGIGGSTTYPDDTNIASIANIQAATAINVTGKGTVVNTTSLAGVSALKYLTVSDGATLIDGGGLATISALSRIEINGGTYENSGQVVDLNLLNNIVVGPSGGSLKISTPSLVGISLSTPISYIDKNGNPTNNPPKNFVVDLPYITYPSLFGTGYVPITVTYNGSTTTIQDDNGLLLQILSDAGVSINTRTIVLDGNPFDLNIGQTKEYKGDKNHPDAVICFLQGSLINTPSGNITVESLNVGDEVIAYVDGVATPRRVTWTGQAHCNVRAHLPDDEAGYPVRILKDAISNGVPFKDMLITAEHCLFFDGKFVPARMLVNGRSIFFDKSITSYDYYHIETEEHSVIMADGMLTESYLDTGNRRTFSQKGKVLSIGRSRNLTWDDAAVPLTVSRETVEPLFRRIEARADKTGIAIHTEAHPLTNESDLHLTTETGAIIRPARQNKDRVMFMIPSDIQSVRIVSNTSRPCDVIGPFVDDRRNLGVLVGEITMFESNRTHTLTAHLHETDLSGWNNVEEGTMRWTAGNALIDLGHRAPGSLGLMAIEIKAAGPYLLDDTLSEKQALQA